MLKTKSATGEIRKHFARGRKLTSFDAFERFGATRLSAIVFQLRAEGMNIIGKMKPVTTRYGIKTNICVYQLK